MSTTSRSRHRMPTEQTRARYPDEEGYVERDGVRSFYEVYGDGRADGLAHADVVDRPLAPLEDADPLPRAALPRAHVRRSRQRPLGPPIRARRLPRGGVRRGRARGDGRDRDRARGRWCRCRAARNDRCCSRRATRSGSTGWCSSRRRCRCHSATPRLKAMREFDEPRDDYIGWGKWNRHYWVEHYEDFLEFFFSQCFTEPHSTKQREDCGRLGPRDGRRDAGRDPAGTQAPGRGGRARAPLPDRLPGARDPRERRRRYAPAHPARGSPSSRTVRSRSSRARAISPTPATRSRSTCSCATSSVPAPPPRSWVRGKSRRKRALYISSPIGLGHAQRDAAIADELRKLHPDLEIDWLAQHPVTAVLEARGERIHPASAFLANESRHIESESAEHDLHCFQAIRRMDEILLSNFMVFHDLVREEQYDLWIGDEAWELDYYLHENPEQKRTPVRLADRLRRLAADARRRRPRGVPDRRLQRGDDRAHRALPARARSGRLRRQPRGHRARAVRVPPARDPRVDRGALLASRATSRASIPPSSPTAQRSGPSSATARTSRSASSPSAARASAATSCGG